jgi:hypothetical protein
MDVSDIPVPGFIQLIDDQEEFVRLAGLLAQGLKVCRISPQAVRQIRSDDISRDSCQDASRLISSSLAPTAPCRQRSVRPWP